MVLNKLETAFFDDILNAELDVPVHAILKYEGTSFELIVIPEIAPEGYLRFRYYNAPPYQPEPQVGPERRQFIQLTGTEFSGTHPLLEEAWQKSAQVELQLKPSQLPIQPKPNPTLDARVLYADVGHRGELVLDQNQVVLSTQPLRRAELSISDFCDFVTPATSSSSIMSISETDRQALQSIADKLADGAKLILHPSPRRVVLRELARQLGAHGRRDALRSPRVDPAVAQHFDAMGLDFERPLFHHRLGSLRPRCGLAEGG